NMRLTNAFFDATNSAGTPGQVLSSTGGGVDWVNAGDADWTIAGSNMFSAVGGAVGIGTSSPSQKLHVQGNMRLTGRLYDYYNSYGTPGQVLSSTGSGLDWINASDADWTISGSNMYSAVSGAVGIGTSSYYQRLNVGGGAYFSGNVGIGTNSPSSALDVAGDIELAGGKFAPAAEEKLRMLRGHVNANGTYSGVGFTAVRNSEGNYTITFSSFLGLPTFVATTHDQPDNWITIISKTSTSVTVETYDKTESGFQLQDTSFDFIILGAR
ncbi:MAG: hypothetical protein K8R53_12580, partial [Bacteroidales bacterium]|nr:hypothetical protein [Bacteroidales bacterium]